MSAIITFSLDLKKLDKNKIIQGEKGSYYPITVFVNDEPDQYNNNVAVTTSASKEEREAKAKTHYLCNGKVVSTDGNIFAVELSSTKAPAAKQQEPLEVEVDFDLPF